MDGELLIVVELGLEVVVGVLLEGVDSGRDRKTEEQRQGQAHDEDTMEGEQHTLNATAVLLLLHKD